MSKLFTGSIDLSKINKNLLYTHKDGRKFLNFSLWLNDEPDQYGNIISVQQQTKKGEDKIYLGNAKEYKSQPTPQATPEPNSNTPEPDDLPF